MPVFYIDHRLAFPSPEYADPSGLLGVGGDLSTERLKLAYQMGIFPWFDPEDPVQWWSPDPRFVLYTHDLHISKSTRPLIRKQRFQITIDQDFPRVIRACKDIYRAGQNGTWISDELEASYIALHEEGIAHSLEVWNGSRLVGGLYGELFGRMFFGESMFSRESNASKVGFLTLVKNFAQHGIDLIDCQIHSNYLESMGAKHIPRRQFLSQSGSRQQQFFDFESFKKSFRQDAALVLG